MSVTTLKSYQNLVNSDTKYWIQTHGETGCYALGCEGSDQQIRLFHNLFCNYDTRARNKWGDFPHSPRLKTAYNGLSYINITKARIYETILAYFRCNIPLLDLKPTKHVNDEGDISFSYENDKIESLAKEATQFFVDNEIKIRMFIYAPTKSFSEEFSVSLP